MFVYYLCDILLQSYIANERAFEGDAPTKSIFMRSTESSHEAQQGAPGNINIGIVCMLYDVLMY